MSKTTFEGYVPSLKERHEATIVSGKAIESKGGSIRYMLQGEYQGRKTLPKTVSKADFESVYGFDAKEAESVLVVGRKDDGSQEVAGHVKGVADKEGFTPSNIQTYDDSIFDRQEIDVKSLKGNLVNHAETVVGNPSPASVEPPAPSETPFPQEPSNENFSAETKAKDEDIYYHIYTYPQKWIDEDGWEGFYTDGKREQGYDFGLYEEIKDTYQEAVNYVDERNKESPLAFAAIWEWDATEGKQKGTLDGEYTDNYNEIINTDPDSKSVSEVKEAFGFGKKEESEEPKTQEFTVVLQQGDKLELTDIEDTESDEDDPKEDNSDSNEENDEKDAEMDDYTDEQLLKVARLDIENQIDNGTMYAIGEEPEPFDDGENFYTIVTLYAQYHKDEDKAEKILWEMFRQEYPQYLGTEVKEAVSAKVTRPVKEEEEPEEESDEGLLTPKNLAIGALGVGALALALGAEDDESDYWAGEEYGVMNAEGVYEAEVNVGEKRIMSRKDYDIDNDLSGFSNMEIGDIDLDDYEEEITDSVEDEIIEAIRESVDDAMPISDGESISSSVYVDTEIDMTVPISGDIDYDWTANETHEDENHDDEWDAEEVSEIEYDEYLDGLEEDALVLYQDNPSHLFEKAYPIDYQVQMNDYESSLLADIQSGYTENSMMFDEDENLTPYGERVLKEMYDSLIDETLGIEWLASIHPPSEILKRGDPMAYRVGLSEYQDAFESESDGYAYAYTKGHQDGIGDDVIYRPSIATDKGKNIYKKILKQKAETFEARGKTQYKLTLDDWPLRVCVDGCPMVKTSDKRLYTPNEIAQESYMILYEHESLPKFEGNTFGELRKASNGLIVPCNCTINEMKVIKELDPATFTREPNETQEHWSETVGSPSPSGPSSTPEPAEATGSEPSNENFESPTKGNLKLIGGISLVAAGLFALGKSDWVADMLDKYMK